MKEVTAFILAATSLRRWLLDWCWSPGSNSRVSSCRVSNGSVSNGRARKKFFLAFPRAGVRGEVEGGGLAWSADHHNAAKCQTPGSINSVFGGGAGSRSDVAGSCFGKCFWEHLVDVPEEQGH